MVFLLLFQQIWACNLCKKKQEILVKTGQWYHGGMAKPVQLDVDTGSDNSSIKTDASPTGGEKKRFPSSDGGGSEKENHPRGVRGSADRGMQRVGSKELKRQYSMLDRERERERTAGSGEEVGGRPPMERGRSLDREMTGSPHPRGGHRGGRFADDYREPMIRGGGRGGRGHPPPGGRGGHHPQEGRMGRGYPPEQGMSPHPHRQSRRPDGRPDGRPDDMR